jgi:hypothetical protein
MVAALARIDDEARRGPTLSPFLTMPESCTVVYGNDIPSGQAVQIGSVSQGSGQSKKHNRALKELAQSPFVSYGTSGGAPVS